MELVRTRCNDQHARLKLRAAELALVAVPFATERRDGSLEDLRARASALKEALASYLAFERDELWPVLRVMDPWGSIRAERAREAREGLLRAIERALDDERDIACSATRVVRDLVEQLEELEVWISALDGGTVNVAQEDG